MNAGGAVLVTATDTSQITANNAAVAASVSGSGSAAISLAVAISLAENSIGGTTLATIDNSTVDAGGSVSVLALANTSILATAAAVGVSVAGSGAFSLSGAGSGAQASNTTTNTVEASIRDGSDVTSGGAVTVSASDTSSITSTLVSVSVSAAISGTAAVSVAIAVTLAENAIGGTTVATIDGSAVHANGGAVNVSALGDNTITATSVSAAISISGSGAVALGGAGTGAVATNTTTSSVEASIVSSTVDAAGDVTLLARNLSNIEATLVSAAVSVTASGAVAAGVAIAITEATNSIGGTTIATIEASDVDTPGEVSVTALADTTIDALGVAVALAVGGSGGVSVSGAGTGVIASNTTTNTIEASITAGSDVDAGGDVTLSATDQSVIDATLVAASVAASGSGGAAINVSIAVSTAENIFGTVTRAAIEGSDVTSTGGGVSLTALSTGSLTAFGVGVGASAGGAGGFALNGSAAGSIADTTTTNVTEAVITDDSNVIANGGSVTLTATDETGIFVDVLGIAVSAGGAGGASVSLSISFAVADTNVSGTVRTMIADSDVSAAGDVILTSLGDSEIDTDGKGIAIAASAAVGFSLSGAGTGADVSNTIGQTVEALILDSNAAEGQSVTAGGKVDVIATDDLHADADALAVSASISGGIASVAVSVAAALAENTLAGVTRARIGNSRVDANGGRVDVKAASTSLIEATPDAYAIAGSFGLGVAGAGAGASATNTVTRTIEGAVDAGSNVTASTLVWVEAHDTSDAIATVDSVAVAVGLTGAAIGVGLAENTMTATTRAHVSDSLVHAEGGEIRIDADATQDVQADASVVAVTAAIGAAGAGGHAVTDLDSTVEAFAHNASLTASGNLFIDADSNHTARAETFGLGAALGFAVSVMISEASIGGATRAFADGATTVNVDSAVQITADSTASALPDGTSISVGLISGAVAKVDAAVDRVTEAYAGARAGTTPGALTTLALGTDDLSIAATSTYTANASPVGLSFGLLGSAAVTLSTAGITGATLAYVGEKATVTAGELDVVANSTENATANNVVVALSAGLSVAVSDSTATIDSDTEAFTGVRAGESPTAGAQTVITLTDAGNGDGTAVIDADGSRTTTASATGGAASFGISVAAMLPTADTSGTVPRLCGRGHGADGGRSDDHRRRGHDDRGRHDPGGLDLGAHLGQRPRVAGQGDGRGGGLHRRPGG